MIEVEASSPASARRRCTTACSFTVERGTLVALIGGSGTGKSVLLREIIGLQRPTAGRVRLLGTDMWRRAATSSTPCGGASA